MNSFGNHDIASARKMLYYLGKSYKHVQEREHAREKLRVELKKLRQISTESLKGFIDDLEDSIENAIDAEKRILKTQSKTENYLKKLQKSINKIDNKVKALMHAHSAHKRQLGFLESEQEKKDFLRHTLRSQLSKLEKSYKAMKKNKKYSKTELKRVADKIKQLKQRLA